MRNPNPMLWSRRRALQTLTVGSSALAYAATWNRELSGLDISSPVRAALAGPPKRLLILFNINGRTNNWIDAGAGGAPFKFSPVTAPLEKHAADLVAFKNLIFATGTDWENTHWGSGPSVLTASLRALRKTGEISDEDWNKTKPVGPSIDAYLGEKLGTVATPQWPSLQMNLRTGPYTFISFNKNGDNIPGYASPWPVYEKMFAGIADGGQVRPDPTLAKRVLMRRSVLDSVTKDLGEFRRRLPLEDRERADAQLDAITTLERRLGNGGELPAGAACKRPTIPATVPDARAARTYPQLVRTTMDLLVAALACDLTRVGMINLNMTQEGTLPCDFEPLNSSHGEHDMSHEYRAEFDKLKAFYLGEVAYLVDRLKAIPEPNGGGSMLDNTIIVWGSEISRGHDHLDLPWLTVGGKNLGVDVGKFMTLPLLPDLGLKNRTERGYFHGRLLLSLINAMGLPDRSFGNAAVTNEPMAGYLRS